MISDTIFEYGEREIEYLRKADKRLAEVIDKVGMIEKRVIPDLFTALGYSIVGQQIATKAHETIFTRMEQALTITPDRLASIAPDELQRFGISFRKVNYIQSAARKIVSGEFDIDALKGMSDTDVCAQLCSLDGVGVWTAEMLMLFSMQRQDILSYGDLAIQRGLRMLYRHRKIDKFIFERYRRRYSPYGSVASLYIWAVAGGAIEGFSDPGAQKSRN